MKRHRKTVLRVMFVLYCVMMLQLLFFRPPSSHSIPYWQTIREKSNLIPFATIREQIHFIMHGTNRSMVHYAYVNLFGNIIAFIPCGIFLPLLGNKTKKLRWTLVVSFALFLAVEIFQLFTLTGRADIDDVLLNLLGCLFGYFLWRTGSAFHKRKAGQKKKQNKILEGDE